LTSAHLLVGLLPFVVLEATVEHFLERQQQVQQQNPNQRPQGGMPQGPPQPIQQVVRQDPKVGRNDPCPCGSGKKYKSCHGK
jgi:uncharacterized protein YecA (UPF0149 family)